MAAFTLVLLIFSYWSILGYALISALYTRRNLLQNALLAPATGASATALLITTLNCANIPVRYGGPFATLLLSMLAFWLLRRYRPLLPVRRLVPFTAVLVVAALAVGYPMFRFGFDWVSYSNDDMANYCLGAKYFLNHGQFEVPQAADLITKHDWSIFYWLLYVVHATRHGADITLAWILSLTKLSGPQAFMPVILAFHLVLIAAAAAMVLQNRKMRGTALLSGLLLAFSALTALGSLYQLFGQVTGLGALCATATVLLRRIPHRRSELFLTAILFAGSGIFYPEVWPFLGLSVIIYHGAQLVRRRETLKGLVPAALLLALWVCLLLNASIPVVLATVLAQSSAGMAASKASALVFPYYLTPAGFAYLWGFNGIGEAPYGIWLDISIVIGFFLFVFIALASCWLASQGRAPAVIAVLMLAMSVQLFRLRLDFGLYKIAMYMQPFLLSSLSLIWVHFYNKHRSAVWRSALIVVLLGVTIGGARGQLYYTFRSMGEGGGGLVELPYASSRRLLSALSAIPVPRQAYLSDTPNVVMGKFQAWYEPVYFVTKDYFRTSLRLADKWNPFYQIYSKTAVDLLNRRNADFTTANFDMHGALPGNNEFIVRTQTTGKNLDMLESDRRAVVLNRRRMPVGEMLVRVVRRADERDYLALVESRFGRSYYLAGTDRGEGRVSMYQVEDDYFLPGHTMVSLGRESLFYVVNPSQEVRMELEYTASLNGDKENRIPNASVIGAERQMFAVTGRGSARLFSPPVRMQHIGQGNYVGLDMGTWGWSFPQRRSAIMKLYGADVAFDSRKIVGFARDISLISASDYASMNPPRSIQAFPSDLESKDLEYCGIYEDGWVGESSYAILKQPWQQGGTLIVTLTIPSLQHGRAAGSVSLRVDDIEVGQKLTSTGAVSFTVPNQRSGRHRIELQFDRAESLPAPDNRPVSGQIRYMGFQPAHVAASR